MHSAEAGAMRARAPDEARIALCDDGTGEAVSRGKPLLITRGPFGIENSRIGRWKRGFGTDAVRRKRSLRTPFGHYRPPSPAHFSIAFGGHLRHGCERIRSETHRTGGSDRNVGIRPVLPAFDSPASRQWQIRCASKSIDGTLANLSHADRRCGHYCARSNNAGRLHRHQMTRTKMNQAKPNIRQAGSGPGVVCLHANASSSSQWRELMDLLCGSHRVVAPDCYGSGQSPQIPSDRMLTLSDEVFFLEPAFASAGTPFALVAHSYGAAVALIAALAQPRRVRALVLYEPTLFALIDASHPPPNDADGIRNVAAAAGAALDVGNVDFAAECFIDFWAGSGTWKAIPSARKPAITSSIINIPQWAHALFTEPTPLAAFRALDMPVLYMLGARSPESSRAVARLLVPVFPRVRVVEFNALGHMGPVTHPELVNDATARFLFEHAVSA